MKIGKIASALAAAAAVAATLAAVPAAGAARIARTAPRMRDACVPARPGHARCFALYAPQVRVDSALAARAAGQQVPAAATKPRGWGAGSIAAAYRLPVAREPRRAVAVVDAFSTPHLAADLAAYRRHYHLPACTVASGCLRIVNQQGKPAPVPKADPLGWGVEETLDVSMVSAACPHCRILVVEATSDSVVNLAAAENTAVRMNASVVSNSYGVRESGFSQTMTRSYHHPGHTIVASSGDDGFTAAQFPANLGSVTAVGGTQLSRAENARGWAERSWHVASGASASGCSAYVPKPSWQRDAHCPGRTTADVAALAWNIPIYDSSLPTGFGPWLTIGGTSAAAPLIAGVYALAGNATTIKPGREYRHRGSLFDVTVGNNALLVTGSARACGDDYLCVARPGYDAPTGLGTPDGTGAF